MERKEFENAIYELLRIKNDVKYKEADFQKWFEKYQIVFTSYGYKTVIPQPKLKDVDGQIFEPDFLVQRFDETWEIFEIKRPDTTILKTKTRRVEFYSSLREYLSQCHDYIEYFVIRDLFLPQNQDFKIPHI
jgi:Shedu protein SduA, C-terminal